MNFIINADDFGLSDEVNRAVADCFKNGVINRTTIMVNMPKAENARRIAEENGFKGSVGLHINLVEGKALSEECRKNKILCDENGFFKGTFHRTVKSRITKCKCIHNALMAEIEAQIKKYIEMGFTLMHADSHQFTHTYPCVSEEVNEMLEKYGFRSVRISRNIPKKDISPIFRIYKYFYNRKLSRLRTNGKKITHTKYFGSMDDFLKFQKEENHKDADIEIMTHPVYHGDILYDDTLPCPKPFFTKETLDNIGITLENFSEKKIKLLVVFVKNHVGGATTSLINFLNTIDKNKYETDLLFYENDNKNNLRISGVNILPQAKIHKKFSLKNILQKALNPAYVIAKIKSEYVLKVCHNRVKSVQIISKQGCRYSRKLNRKYDIAIAYELDWCLYYTMKYVNADKKIIWHHNDYEAFGYDFRLDKKYFDMADRLVFVSTECMNKFIGMHGEYRNKSYFIPNLLPESSVIKRACEPIVLPFERNKSILTLLTVARIEFSSKGPDRMITVFCRLRSCGLLDRIRWLVIGKGNDSDAFARMIKENNLENHIFQIGLKENPIPYMKECDAFLLPSRNEGKPMVITEAQIIGLVPIVAEYTSAPGQIKNNIDGLIFKNDIDAIYEGLKDLILHPEKLEILRNNLKNETFGNEKEIKRFDDMIEKLM